MLTATNVSVSYGKSVVINNLSLHIEQGSITAILGRNGVGKTTFLKSAMGILPMTNGSLMFNGTDISRLRPYKRSLEGLGYVPQGREIIPLMTVNENLELGAMGHKRVSVIRKKEWVLEYFPALKGRPIVRGASAAAGHCPVPDGRAGYDAAGRTYRRNPTKRGH